ncbi:MAG: hypothetical protein IJ124_05220 [Clostridia bacterium]|nr:hypothetical protein [Clostridia bacterium]MBQ8708094.1 hypothetical protein [Succinivibrionaceae bacterium]MBQ8708140.1 hypothetical protein [Succinivibrionaceae bacterium]
MAVDVEYIRRIAGADPEESVELLEAIRDAAVEWYEKADVPRTTEGPLYRFWVANLAAWMYDNRGNADALAAIPSYIVTSVHQLRPRRESQRDSRSPSATAGGRIKDSSAAPVRGDKK